MVERQPLTNDGGDGTEGLEVDVGTLESIVSIPRSESLGPLLSCTERQVYSFNDTIKDLLTLRKCNEHYRDAGGCKYGEADIPEFDRCITKGCISPLRRFDNCIGHFVHSTDADTKKETYVLSYPPTIVESANEFGEILRRRLMSSIRTGQLWSLRDINACIRSEDGTWKYAGSALNDDISSCIDVVSESFTCPLSMHTIHAWLESTDDKGITKVMNTFVQPQETTAVPGVFGTIHNCQIVDLATEKDGEYPNMEARDSYVDGYDCFLGVMHTSHSTEAGRVRKVANYTEVRILTSRLVATLATGIRISSVHNNGPLQWLLYCMGYFLKCTTKFLSSLRDFLVSSSSTYCHTAVLHINTDMRCAILSVSSGVLLARDYNGMIIDSTSAYNSRWHDGRHVPVYHNDQDNDGFKYYVSGFELLVPYIVQDRQPRSLIASVQHIQAVAFPYGAGTSSVSPNYISKPLVMTPLMEKLLSDDSADIADNIPGQAMMVAFINANDTYEDAVIMSNGSTARGLYSYMAFSAHLINGNEKVPDPGGKVNIKDNRWWKVYARDTDYRHIKLTDGRTPIRTHPEKAGTVISKSDTASGQISVKVLRVSSPATGDKTATWHGQKGVLKLWPDEDMPYGIDEYGNVLKFDMVVSLASITNRLTMGQYYEMISGAYATRTGRRVVVKPHDIHNMHLSTVIYDGRTGLLVTRTASYGEDEDPPVYASWGICTVFQMTQMTEDKQHYTHNTSGPFSTTAPTGRTAGGGIRVGEMDGHSMESSGLRMVKNELKSRMDLLELDLCTRCDTLAIIHRCGMTDAYTRVSLPRSKKVLDLINLITNGFVTKYIVSP